MGVDTTKWTLADYLANAPAVGLSPANFVPSKWRSICQDVANNSIPTKAPSTFSLACNASLIIRGLLYFKSNPGDCGSPTSLDLENASLTGFAGNAAGAGLSIAKSIAGVGSGIASMAGAVLPGISVAVSAIEQIFANHAQAVANEQTTICKVAGVMNQVIPYYDNLVRTGKINPSDAYSGMQSFIQQVDEALSAIMKSCDAACVYTAILQAHYTFVEKYYPLIAPVTATPHAPGAPPASTNTTPGGIVQAGNPRPVASPVVPAPTPKPEVSTDYFGNSVQLGMPFFSSTLGTTTLPGVAGDYFPRTILPLDINGNGIPNENPPNGNTWGLGPNSIISNGQYAQLVYQGALATKGGGKKTPNTTFIVIILAIVAAIYFVTKKGNPVGA